MIIVIFELTSWIILRVLIKASSVEISSHKAVCWLLQGWNFRKVKVKKWKCKWRKNVRGERESGRSESEENWVKQSEIVSWMWWSTAAALRGWHGPPKYWRQVKVKRSKEKWKWNKLREKNEIGGCMW